MLSLEKFDLAEDEYRGLVDGNPDNVDYLLGLERSKKFITPLDKEKTKAVLEMYAQLSQKYPTSHVLRRLPLNHASGEDFKTLLDSYLVKMFRKGVPSLFNSFKDLLVEKEKASLITDVVEGYHRNLLDSGVLYQGSSGNNCN